MSGELFGNLSHASLIPDVGLIQCAQHLQYKIVNLGESERKTSKALQKNFQVYYHYKELLFLLYYVEYPGQCRTGHILTILEHMLYPRALKSQKSIL